MGYMRRSPVRTRRGCMSGRWRWRRSGRGRRWGRPGGFGVFLGLCVAGVLLIGGTADLGGRLVHKYGVHAQITSADPPVVHERAMAVQKKREAEAAEHSEKE